MKWTVIAVLLGQAASSAPASCSFEQGTDYEDPAGPEVAAATQDACCTACKADASCAVGVWDPEDKKCYMKTSATKPVKKSTGVVSCHSDGHQPAHKPQSCGWVKACPGDKCGCVYLCGNTDILGTPCTPSPPPPSPSDVQTQARGWTPGHCRAGRPDTCPPTVDPATLKGDLYYPNYTVGQGYYFDFTYGDMRAGIGSASYDYYLGGGPDRIPWIGPPVSGIGDQREDALGAVLMAYNPKTGQFVTDINATDQFFNATGSYRAGAGHTSLKPKKAVFPITEMSPITKAMLEKDFIFFTIEQRPWQSESYMGMFAMTSANGRILGDPTTSDGSPLPWEGYLTYYPHPLKKGEHVGRTGGSFNGEDTIVYVGVGWPGIWHGGVSEPSEAHHGMGFEFDGCLGWLKFDNSGDRAGLILKESYMSNCVDQAQTVLV